MNHSADGITTTGLLTRWPQQFVEADVPASSDIETRECRRFGEKEKRERETDGEEEREKEKDKRSPMSRRNL